MLNNNGKVLYCHQVPPHYQEKFILSGYRYRFSLTDCLRSIFDVHNETLNFWTHFVPAWYFFWHLIFLLDTHDFINDRYSWPLFAFMIASCAYPFSSSFAHLLCSMSHRTRHICFFFDYAGLSFYAFGVAIAYRAYAMPAMLLGTTYATLYLYSCFAVCLLCTVVTCLSRLLLEHFKYSKTLKIAAFCVMYFWVSAPVMYRLSLYAAEDPYANSHWVFRKQFVLAFVTCFLYATHIPERFMPGKFDFIGHSHMLFHMSSVMATNEQINALLIDMKQRKDDVLDAGDVLPFTWSIGALCLLTVMNLVIVFTFIVYLYRSDHGHDD
ncbi:PREDICTED: membrane progestin receptor gamma-B-like [Priapulus caudatus]|uniref:Membrane progestin receptor gamma-B-like n=1 Tax=Priapulus caudatus TaxID=37621 RepID=A0ABM1DQB9_PRICU|nr:PREDICTED: membrane progestin receptor gamma-B-like [Priapulus caudatus]XP_014662140.1 PREDICTED: membrane progestin receptor gamma-B-like [Priapulus caudatus]